MMTPFFRGSFSIILEFEFWTLNQPKFSAVNSKFSVLSKKKARRLSTGKFSAVTSIL